MSFLLMKETSKKWMFSSIQINLKIAENITQTEQTEIINADGKYLLPGLIDDQVHFREPGLTHKACIRTESRALWLGELHFIEMPNTKPQTTTLEELERKFSIAEQDALANYSFMFGGTNDNFDEKLDTKAVAGLKLFLGSSRETCWLMMKLYCKIFVYGLSYFCSL